MNTGECIAVVLFILILVAGVWLGVSDPATGGAGFGCDPMRDGC